MANIGAVAVKKANTKSLKYLQAIAGERQDRDSSNNPQIPDEKVPKGSAASKTSSGRLEFDLPACSDEVIDN